jgi:hypothetical protein
VRRKAPATRRPTRSAAPAVTPADDGGSENMDVDGSEDDAESLGLDDASNGGFMEGGDNESGDLFVLRQPDGGAGGGGRRPKRSATQLLIQRQSRGGLGVVAQVSPNLSYERASERVLGAACEGFYGRGGDRSKRGSEGAGGVRGQVRPSTCAAEHMCACATSPAAGGVRGVSPRQPEILPDPATEEQPRVSEATEAGERGVGWRERRGQRKEGGSRRASEGPEGQRKEGIYCFRPPLLCSSPFVAAR